MKIKSPEMETQITTLLSQRYFVPVLRPVDFSSPAVVGRPWSPDILITSPESPVHITSPLAVPAASKLIAYAARLDSLSLFRFNTNIRPTLR